MLWPDSRSKKCLGYKSAPTTSRTPHPKFVSSFRHSAVPHLSWKNDTGSTEVDFDCPETQKLLLNLFISGFHPEPLTSGQLWTWGFHRAPRFLAGFSASSTPCKLSQLDLSNFWESKYISNVSDIYFSQVILVAIVAPETERRRRLFVILSSPAARLAQCTLDEGIGLETWTFIGKLGRNFSNVPLSGVLTEPLFSFNLKREKYFLDF